MGKIKKCFFYYGAILDAIFQYNPDSTPSLVYSDENAGQVYRVLTNTSKEECILWLKYATEKDNIKNPNYRSWPFSFTDADKEKLQNYSNEGKPLFIYLLCAGKNLNDNEIAILKYEEFKNLSENKTITIGLVKSKHKFNLYSPGSKSRENTKLISRNRIEMMFDQLLENELTENKKQICCKSTKSEEAKENQKTKIFEYSNTCPICKGIIDDILFSIGTQKYSVHRCKECGHFFANRKDYFSICEIIKPNLLSDKFNIMNDNKIKNNDIYIEEKENDNNSKEIIYYIDENIKRCPIHNCKLEYKPIQFGKIRDVIGYCKYCHMKIISQKQKIEICKLINMQKSIYDKQYVFKVYR